MRLLFPPLPSPSITVRLPIGHLPVRNRFHNMKMYNGGLNCEALARQRFKLFDFDIMELLLVRESASFTRRQGTA